MQTQWSIIERFLKHALAGTLFIALLVGASALSLLMFATAVDSLSGQVPVATVSSTASAAQPPKSPPVVKPKATKSSTSATQRTANVFTGPMSVGQAIDSGGISIGMRVQTAVGHLLSGVLKTLFLSSGNSTS
jgi:hypothetical protein